MKMNEPIGKAIYGPLLIRLSLGSYFILAGLGKLPLLFVFISQVKSFGVLPENLATLYATLLPYLEIFVGGSILLGLWTTLAGLMATMLLASFIIAFGFFPGDHTVFSKDVILAAGALSLLYSGPGAYSIDNLRKAHA